MSSKRLDSISDYPRHGYDLRVTCRACGRVGVIDALALTMRLSKSNKSKWMPYVESRPKCSDCGLRDLKCGPVEKR